MKGGVEVDEIYGLIREVLTFPEDVQVVAVVEDVGLHSGSDYTPAAAWAAQS